jgi:hypothetical protein
VGLDGGKVFSPDMIRRGHSERESERENSTSNKYSNRKFKYYKLLTLRYL